MSPPPDYFIQWCALFEKKMDALSGDVKELKEQTLDIWKDIHTETEKVRSELRVVETDHGQKLSSHSTELSIWRWALLVMAGMVITSMVNLALSTMHLPMPRSEAQTGAPK